ncbi:cytochrome P450 3A24-like [Centruroides sculpturatus]|uniref:cytochrome P450 3A24-like n=1 Tax=Centruroides sculpturatus TaxID=218467 RepID=UPI000C6DCFD6|nr:cytochrome P450 3A24-like [Centruroides sculpturatus]
MDPFSITVSFFLLVITIFLWYRWRINKLSLFTKLGIPGPKPSFWTGNLKEIIEKGINCESEWIEKYGKIVGYFFGTRPILLIADPELLKIVLVKDFTNFMNKDVFVPYAGVSTEKMKYAIGLQKDKQWKFIRSVITPSFSSVKLKSMMPIFNESIEVFLDKISQEESKKSSFDVYPMYKKMVLDIITKNAFGISTNVQLNDDNIYLKCVLRVLNNGAADILNFVSLCFPETEPIPSFLKITIDKFRSKLGLPSVTMLVNICETVIKKRKSDPQSRRPDLLQSLIDSSISKEELSNTKIEELEASDDSKEKHSTTDKNKSSKNLQFLTKEEITANAMVFIIAGYDTTSSLLAFTTHFLVNNQNIQDKVRKEIMDNVDCEKQLTIENLSKLTYLDQVCSETLRLFPPLTSFINRITSKQFYYKNIKIPEGLTLQAPLWQMQRNTEYWDNPEIFDPERFSPENKSKINQMMYQPFGMGPRNCIGIRMAKTIVKLALSHLLYKYKLLPSEETDSELNIDPKLFVNYPKNGMKVMAVSC